MNSDSENECTTVVELCESSNDEITLDFEEKLILLVQAEPILYDLQDSNYFNKKKKDKEWKDISKNCGRSIDECKSRWKSMRDTFMREKRKVSKSGSGSSVKKPWRYMQALEFLTPTLTKAKSNSNYQTQVEEHSNSPENRSASVVRSSNKNKRPNLEEKIVHLIESDLEEDSDTKFALSLVDPLRRLDRKLNNLARIRIQQVLYDIEFGSE